MDYSRRDLSLLPWLAMAAAKGLFPERAAAENAAEETLPSKTYRFEDLPVKETGQNRSRAVLDGKTHAGFPLEMHMTELAPGGEPHPPHRHPHEEMIMIHQGTLEVTISGKIANLGPGSSAYVASNELHGWRNVGDTRALYFVLALGRGAIAPKTSGPA